MQGGLTRPGCVSCCNTGGWWFSKPEMSVGELREMKARELNNGRLASARRTLRDSPACYMLPTCLRRVGCSCACMQNALLSNCAAMQPQTPIPVFVHAVVAFTGVYAASMVTGKGPVTLLFEHVADPSHTTVLQALQR